MCVRVNRIKGLNLNSRGSPLDSLHVFTGRSDSISMYLLFGLPKDSYGNNVIVIFVDCLSKMAHLAAVPDSTMVKVRL